MKIKIINLGLVHAALSKPKRLYHLLSPHVEDSCFHLFFNCTRILDTSYVFGKLDGLIFLPCEHLNH